MIDLKQIKAHFWEGYQSVNKIKPKWGAKEGDLFNKLKKHCEDSEITQDDLTATMDWYFGLDGDFESKVKHDFGNFYAQFNKYYLDFQDNLNRVLLKAKVQKQRVKEYEENKKQIDENYQPRQVRDMTEKIRQRYENDYPRFSNMMNMTYKPKYICERTDKEGEPLHRGKDKQCDDCRESQIHKMWVKMMASGQEVFGREKMVELYKEITEPKKKEKDRKRLLQQQAEQLTT